MARLTIAVTMAVLLAAGASAAQDPGAEPPAAPAASSATDAADADEVDSDPLKIICRRVQPPTGTRIINPQTRQHLCMSRADWEQQELDAQEALGERDKGICSGGSCAG